MKSPGSIFQIKYNVLFFCIGSQADVRHGSQLAIKAQHVLNRSEKKTRIIPTACLPVCPNQNKKLGFVFSFHFPQQNYRQFV